MLGIIAEIVPYVFIGWLLWMLWFRDDDKSMSDEETQMLSEIHAGMKNLEERVENLETIFSVGAETERIGE